MGSQIHDSLLRLHGFSPSSTIKAGPNATNPNNMADRYAKVVESKGYDVVAGGLTSEGPAHDPVIELFVDKGFDTLDKLNSKLEDAFKDDLVNLNCKTQSDGTVKVVITMRTDHLM